MREDINFFIERFNALLEQKHMIKEGVKEDVINKWQKVDPKLDIAMVKRYIDIYDNFKKNNFNGAFNDENEQIKQFKMSLTDLKDITKYPDFMTFENAMDYVRGKSAPKNSILDDTDTDSDLKPVYADNNVEIYVADSRKKCIAIKNTETGRNYTWCIADNNLSQNAFYTYRFTKSLTIYMVKNLNLIREKKFNDIWHFFVVQPSRDGQYLLTSAQNGDDKFVDFSEIVKICPYLKGKEKIFKYIPLSPTEEKYYNLYKDGISDEEFLKLSPEEKEIYLDVTAGGQPLSARKYISLNEKLQQKFLNFGLPLTPELGPEVEKNKNNLKTYLRKLKIRFERLVNRETETISETDFDLFAKYNPDYVITYKQL